MRGPDFVDSDFACIFVHADFGHLGRVGIRWRGSNPGAFVFAAARIWRRGVGTRAGQSAVEVDGGDYGFFEGHPIFWAFVLAFLLQGSAQDLSFDAATDRGSRLSDI